VEKPSEQEQDAYQVILAAKKGDMARVRSLCEDNPSLSAAKSKTDETVLHWVSRYARGPQELSLVEFLIENGADVNALDNSGMTPLHAGGRRRS